MSLGVYIKFFFCSESFSNFFFQEVHFMFSYLRRYDIVFCLKITYNTE